METTPGTEENEQTEGRLLEGAMADESPELVLVAKKIALDSVGSQYPDALLQYIGAILGTQRRLLHLEQQVADTKLTFEGYRSQRRLDRLASQYNDLSQHVEQISESMLTCRLGDVDGVDSAGFPDDDSLLDAIGSGSIPRHLGRLERTSARVNQQLVAKQNAATTRVVAVVSLVAAIIALASLLVTILPDVVL